MYITPINFNNINAIQNKNIKFCASSNRISNDKVIDCNDLYSNDEIKGILIAMGTYPGYNKYVPMFTVKNSKNPKMDVAYDKEKGELIFDCRDVTNHTTIIKKDGSAVSCGSFHNKEIAPAGTYSHLIGDVEYRIDNKK